MQQYLSFRAYARRRGLNVSTISRQVALGHIPTVTTADGRRLIDPAEADAARARNLDPGRGGVRDTRQATDERRWRNAGYHPSQARTLNTLLTDGPRHLQYLLGRLGADELEIARAVVALGAVIEDAGVSNTPLWAEDKVLEPLQHPDWSDRAELEATRCAEVFDELMANDEWLDFEERNDAAAE